MLLESTFAMVTTALLGISVAAQEIPPARANGPRNGTIASDAYVFVFNNGDIDYYYEAKGMTQSTDNPRLWVMEGHKALAKLQPRTYKRLYELDCRERRMRMLSATAYLGNGVVAGSSDQPTAWVYVAPETVAVSMLMWACPNQ